MGMFAARRRSVSALDHFEVLNIANRRLQVVMLSTISVLDV